jgi:hypothetical protein
MTLDRLVALSLLAPAACPELVARLAAGDPSLNALAEPQIEDAATALWRRLRRPASHAWA